VKRLECELNFRKKSKIEKWQLARLTSAHESEGTVASFRTWRGSQPIVARGRTSHRDE